MCSIFAHRCSIVKHFRPKGCGHPRFCWMPLILQLLMGPEIVENTSVSVAFASFELDGSRFEDPHSIEPQIVHDLKIEANISRWRRSIKGLLPFATKREVCRRSRIASWMIFCYSRPWVPLPVRRFRIVCFRGGGARMIFKKRFDG